MRITVLTGGATPERTVALAGAAQIVAALRSRGHTVRVVDTTQGLVSEGEETRLLASTVGAGPSDVGDLEERERAMLGSGLGKPARGARCGGAVPVGARGRGGGWRAAGGARPGRRALHGERAARERARDGQGPGQTPVPGRRRTGAGVVHGPGEPGGRDHRARMAGHCEAVPRGIDRRALARPEREGAGPGAPRSRGATTTT